MGRIKKFLRQTCSFERRKLSPDGTVLRNKYGEVEYDPPVSIPCRKEDKLRIVATTNGTLLQSTTRYYTDSDVLIIPEDKLDGKQVLVASELIGASGRSEGTESYV